MDLADWCKQKFAITIIKENSKTINLRSGEYMEELERGKGTSDIITS